MRAARCRPLWGCDVPVMHFRVPNAPAAWRWLLPAPSSRHGSSRVAWFVFFPMLWGVTSWFRSEPQIAKAQALLLRGGALAPHVALGLYVCAQEEDTRSAALLLLLALLHGGAG